MKKFLLGLIAVMVLSIIFVTMPKKEESEKAEVGTEDTEALDSLDGFFIETLSDKDIYYHLEETGATREFLPDSVRGLVDDLTDAANGFAIMRAAYCDAELWFRMGMVINDKIGKVRTDVIKDEGVRIAAEKYVRTLVDVLPKDTALWDERDSVVWDKVWRAYTSYGDKLSDRFALKHYGKITEKDVEKYLDIRLFIPKFDSIYALRKDQSEENERYLKMMAQQALDFDRKCLYTIELAHQSRYDEAHPALPMLEELMVAKQYSRYLHEVWRTWRCVKQIGISPSRDGMIPNLEYNQMRFRCLNTVLRQIIDHPKDIMAINQFLFMASYDNIIRYSSYMFGNSAPLEQMVLFPEILEDNEDN